MKDEKTIKPKNTSNELALTPKQERFCQEYVKTGNKSEAYRLAYSSNKMTNASINTEASSMYDNPKITLRIQELKKRIELVHEIDIDWCISKLKTVVLDDDKDRVAALDKLMKHLGGYEKNNHQKKPNTLSEYNLANLTEDEKDQLFELSLKLKYEN